jgi:hypothetical protein
LDKVRGFARRMVERAVEQIKLEEMGIADVQNGKGLLIRELLRGGLTDIEEIIDSCLTFILAGELSKAAGK